MTTYDYAAQADVLLNVKAIHPDAELMIVGPEDHVLLRISGELTEEDVDRIREAFKDSPLSNRVTILGEGVVVTRMDGDVDEADA